MLDISAADAVAYFGNSAGDAGDEFCYAWGGAVSIDSGASVANELGELSCIRSAGGNGTAVLWIEYLFTDTSAGTSGEHGMFKVFFWRQAGNYNTVCRASRMLFAEANTGPGTSVRIDNPTTVDDDDFLGGDTRMEMSLAIQAVQGATDATQTMEISLVNAQNIAMTGRVMGRFVRGGDQTTNMTFVPVAF